MFHNALFGAAAAWQPQPGYWYNKTNTTIEIQISEEWGAPEIVYLEPHELIKMAPFKDKQIRGYGDKFTSADYKKKGAENSDRIVLNKQLLSKFGPGEYVIVFINSRFNESGLAFTELPEKEFREKYAKELEAYPVPGGIQRIISSYVCPAPEKTKTSEQ